VEFQFGDPVFIGRSYQVVGDEIIVTRDSAQPDLVPHPVDRIT
jgi:hypothetical protein